MNLRYAPLLMALAIVSSANPASAKEPRESNGWQSDFRAAEAQSRELQKPLVVHFHAAWCGPCQNMERTVLSQAATLSLLGDGVIGVKVDSDANRDVVRRFGVTALPTDIFLDAAGKEVGRTTGTQELNGYLGRLQALAGRSAAKEGASPPHVVAKPALPPVQNPVQNSNVIRLVLRPVETPVAEAPAATSPAEVTATSEGDESPADAQPFVESAEAPSLVRVVSEIPDADGFRIGFAGFSPVAYAGDQSWQPGQAEFAVEYLGVKYLLGNADEQEQFQQRPETFAPALHGFDPVLLKDRRALSVGMQQHVVAHQSRLYFFVSADNAETFHARPERYMGQTELQLFRKQAAASE